MKEIYSIDMEKTQHPKLLAEIPDVDIVVTMGCNVHCQFLPCDERFDWGLEDPSGQPDEKFREVIAQIEHNILELAERFRQAV